MAAERHILKVLARQGGLALVMAMVLLVLPAPSWSAGGPGDGTTESSWLEDPRLLDALVAIGAHDYPKAVGILDTLVADKPGFADAWNYLGYALRKGGRS